jgi:hypothetical protein
MNMAHMCSQWHVEATLSRVWTASSSLLFFWTLGALCLVMRRTNVLLDVQSVQKLSEYRTNMTSYKKYDYRLLVRYDFCKRTWESHVYEMHYKRPKAHIQIVPSLEEGKARAERKLRDLWEARKRKDDFGTTGWHSYLITL